jgi:hypothetical protein
MVRLSGMANALGHSWKSGLAGVNSASTRTSGRSPRVLCVNCWCVMRAAVHAPSMLVKSQAKLVSRQSTWVPPCSVKKW